MAFNDKKNKPSRKKIIIIVLILFLMLGSFEAGFLLSQKDNIINAILTEQTVSAGKVIGKYSGLPGNTFSQDINFDLFWKVWDSLSENYVDKEKLNEKKMFYGAIRGMVGSLDDPYTVFMEPQIAKEFNDDLAGTFEGIGAEIGIKNDILTIIAPLPEMPAEKAGLKPGDKVYAIDGESTAGMNIDEAVNKIRGPRETEVVLSITREGQNGLAEIPITRGQIIVKSVRTETRENGIFVIKITNFNEDTENLFNGAVKEALKNDPQGIILDLRSNPGGFLDTAIETASEWVEEGVIVTEKYTDDRKTEHLARGRARLSDYRTVVLVNRGSASASEIVAGALQDYGHAVIVGKQTFGKGSVQTLTELPDGSSIKITIAKWLTPKGRSINDDGIMPNVEIDLTNEDYNQDLDPQMDKALEILSSGKPLEEFFGEPASSTPEQEE